MGASHLCGSVSGWFYFEKLRSVESCCDFCASWFLSRSFNTLTDSDISRCRKQTPLGLLPPPPKLVGVPCFFPPPPPRLVLAGGRYSCSRYRFVSPHTLTLWPSHDPRWFDLACFLAVPPHPPGYDHDLRVKHLSDALTEKHGAATGEWGRHVGKKKEHRWSKEAGFPVDKSTPTAALALCIFFKSSCSQNT